MKQSMKLVVSLLAGITLGSSVIGSFVSVVSASEIQNCAENQSIVKEVSNHSYLKMMNDTLLKAGFSQEDINCSSFVDRQLVYKTLLEKSEKGRFIKKVTEAIKRIGGKLGRFAKSVGYVSIAAHIIRAWDAYDGTPSRVLYHVFRFFGVSRTTAHRWTRVIMSQL